MPMNKKKSKSKSGTTSPRSAELIVRRNGFPNLTDNLTLPRQVQSKVYDIFQAFISNGYLQSSATVPTYTAININLNQFPQATSLAAVFDLYRCMTVEYTLEPVISSVDSISNNAGTLFTALDYDDSNVPSSTTTLLEYANCITTVGYLPVVRTQIPAIAVAAYSGAFTSYAERQRMWLNCSSLTIQHYGMKTAWTNTSNTAFQYNLYVRAWFQFKQSH